MQMMIEPNDKILQDDYTPKHMKDEAPDADTIEVHGLDELRKLINEIPDGTIYSIDLEVFADGQEDG